jgi:hypothetical protein
VRDEWAFDDYYRREIFKFVREYPLEELRLVALKGYVLFFSIRTLTRPPDASAFQRLSSESFAFFSSR